MEGGSEEEGRGDVLMNLREEHKEGLASSVAKKVELVSTQTGLEAVWIKQLVNIHPQVNQECQVYSWGSRNSMGDVYVWG